MARVAEESYVSESTQSFKISYNRISQFLLNLFILILSARIHLISEYRKLIDLNNFEVAISTTKVQSRKINV